MKLNTITTWPHVHVCLLDLTCWREMWAYGSPMRIYWGGPRSAHGGFVDVPGLKQLAAWRSEQIWSDELCVAEEESGSS